MAIHRGYIVVMDVLGTKEATRRDLKLEWSRRMALTKHIESFTDRDGVSAYYSPVGGTPFKLVRRAQSFSDTFFMSAVPEPEAPGWSILELFAVSLAAIFRFAIGEKLLLRGAVAYGEFVDANGVILGEALNEAACWHASTDWAGIIAAPSAEREIVSAYERNPPGTVTWFDRYAIPFKQEAPASGSRPKYALAWPGDGTDQTRELLLYRFNQSQDASVAAKRENTMRFYDYVSEARDPRTGERRYGSPAS